MSAQKLERKFGLWATISLGIGATIGSGIFSTISQIASISQSSIILMLAFIFGGLLQIPSNFCYAELSSAYPEDGGFFIYIKEAGAKHLAFFCGWAAFWLIEPPSLSIMAIALANYLATLTSLDPYMLRIVSVAIIMFFTFLNIKTVEGGSIAQTILTVLKIVPFIFIICVGLFFINIESYGQSSILLFENGSFNVSWIIALVAATSATTFAYDGMYAPSYMTGEIKNPRKTMPLAFMIMTFIIVGLFAGLSFVSCGLISCDDLSNSSAPIAEVASKIPAIGDAAWAIIAAIAVVVITGTISTATIYMPRLTYAMAKHDCFFKVFSKVHPKYNSPHVAILCNGILAAGLTFFGSIGSLLVCLTFATLIRNTSTFASVLFLRKKPGYNPSYQCPLGLFFPIVATIFALILLVGVFLNDPIQCCILTLLLFGTGYIAYYFWNKSKKNRSS